MRSREGVGCRLIRAADEKRRRLLKVSFVPDSIPGTGNGSLAQITLVYSSVFVVSYILSECLLTQTCYIYVWYRELQQRQMVINWAMSGLLHTELLRAEF